MNLQILWVFSKEKWKTGKVKIVHVGYAKRTLENWVTFSYPRSLSISVTFFFLFLIQLKKKTFNAQLFTEKKQKIHCDLYIMLELYYIKTMMQIKS